MGIKNIFAALAAILLLSCEGLLGKNKLISIQGKTMGTHYRVKYFPSSSNPPQDKLLQSIDDTLKEINRQMSTYWQRSEISFFNYSRHLNWQSISEDFYTTLKYSLQLAKKTDGAFDPTIGPLVNLWGFGPGQKKEASD